MLNEKKTSSVPACRASRDHGEYLVLQKPGWELGLQTATALQVVRTPQAWGTQSEQEVTAPNTDGP